MKKMILVVTVIFAQFAFAKPVKLEKKFNKTCAALAEFQDADLSKALKACDEDYKVGSVKLLVDLNTYAENRSSRPSNTFRAVVPMLEKFRGAVVKSDEWNRPKYNFDVSAKLAELSGFAFDAEKNVIWGISDETPDLVKITLPGFKIESVHISNVESEDTEAVIVDESGMVWVMDTGDNDNNRNFGLIYVFNPENVKNGTVEAEHTMQVHFPNGKKPNIESAFIVENEIFFVEKVLYGKPEIFSADFMKAKSQKLITKSVGILPSMGPISDVTVDPISSRVFALGWFGISEIIEIDSGLKTKPIWSGFVGQQEALAYNPNKKTFYIGTEEGGVVAVPLP